MSRIAIFASGSGTNAENIINYFTNRLNKDDFHIFCNTKKAFINERSKKLDVKFTLFSREDFFQTDKILNILINENTELIVLAGFLWLIPENIINAFKNRIINIHPALLPKYGGKGMYGSAIHKAVVENKEKESGITIHYVDKNYDEGKILLQEKFDINSSDTCYDVERKAHLLEYKHYPKVIEKLLNI